MGSTQPPMKMSTRNIPGGKGGRCVGLTASPPSRTECHESWEPKPPGTLWATLGLLLHCCIIDVYSLNMARTGSKYIGVNVLMFNCKIIYYSIVYFVGVVLCNCFICAFALFIKAVPCKMQPKHETCINTETSIQEGTLICNRNFQHKLTACFRSLGYHLCGTFAI